MENSRKKQRLFAQPPKVREARFLDFFRKKDSDPEEGNEEGEGGSSLSDLIKGKGKGKGKAVVVNGPLFTIITTVSPEVTRTIVATSVLTLEPSPPPPPPPPPPPATTPTSTAVQEPPKTLTPIVPVPVLPVQILTPLVPTRSETQAPQESSSSLVESSSSLEESTTTLTEPSSTTADIAVDVPTTFSTATMPLVGSTPYAGGWSPEATNVPTGLPAPNLSRLSSGQVAGIVAGTAVGFIIILGSLLFAMRKWKFGFFRQQNHDGSPSSSQRRMRLSSIFTRNHNPSQQFGYSAYATADRRYSSSTASPFLERPRQALADWFDRAIQLLPSRAYRTEPMPVLSEKAPPYYGATITKPKSSHRNLMNRMRDRLPISRPIPPPIPPHDIESNPQYPPPPTITMTPPIDPPRRSIGSIVSTIFNIRRSQAPTPPPKTKGGFLAPSTRGRTSDDDSTPGAYIFRQSGTSDLSGWTGPATRTSHTDSGAFIAPTALSPPLTHPRYAFGGTERDPFGRVVVRSPIAAGDRRRTVRFSMQRVGEEGRVESHGRVGVDVSPTSGSGTTRSECTRGSLESFDSGEREGGENRI